MATESFKIPGYEMLRPLGTGGMSTVYLALQRSLDRNVAIKVMKRVGGASSEEAKQFERRFLLEGRTMAALPHRNIVAVYDIVTNDEISYIVMEYLDGGTLSDRVRGGMRLDEALPVIVQTAAALEFAHGRGIVHRDLKPSNIMFRDGTVPVLTDFGIARQQDSAATALTQAGMMVGTPQYMSPEQINGQVVDGRADQYSLGVMFYELLTGTQPFTGDSSLAVLMAHLTKEAPPLPADYAGLQDIVGRMLAKDREQRYPNLGEFIAELKGRLTQDTGLLERLQLNSARNLSEQLHDLGFDSNTSPQVNTGGSMPRITTLPGSAPAPRSQPSRTARRPPAAPPPRRTLPWTWIGAALAAVVLVGVLWFALGRRGLSDDVQAWVGIRLERAEQRIGDGQLVGENSAYADLQDVLQKDADNARANQLLDKIAAELGAQAQRALDENHVDQALDLGNQSLLVRPDNAAAKALKAKIADAQRGAQQKQRIADLVQAAESAAKAGRMFGDKSAYALLTRAKALAPDNTDVAQRIGTLVSDELGKAERALSAGELAAAAATLATLEPSLSGEPGFVALKARLAAATQKQQADSEIAALASRADAQIRAGRLAGTTADNAAQTLGELRKLAADDARTANVARALAQALLAQARQRDAAGHASDAIGDVDLALQADAQAPGAAELKAQIEARLGQREADIARALAQANAAINEQRFVPPAQNDAYGALQALLKLDPENREGKALAAALPQRIAAAVQARAAKDASGAGDLLAAARKVYPDDAALVALQSQVGAQLARELKDAAAKAQRERVAALLGSEAPDVDKLRGAGRDLAALASAGNSGDETRKLRERLVVAIDARLRAADASADVDAVAALVAEDKALLGNEPGYAALVAALPAQRAKVAAAEQARAEAERGELVLNAYPWGRVESIVDANGKPVALPAETVTPLTLALPAGSYIAIVRHPNAKPTRVIAKVEAGKRNSASASFPTLNARDYFSRAGW